MNHTFTTSLDFCPVKHLLSVIFKANQTDTFPFFVVTLARAWNLQLVQMTSAARQRPLVSRDAPLGPT